VLWVRLAVDHGRASTHENLVALLRGALHALSVGPGGPKAARTLLERFEAGGGTTDNLCDAGAEKRLRKIWKQLWKETKTSVPEIQPRDDVGEVPVAKLPVPSATVNGRLLRWSEDMERSAFVESLGMLCKDEVEALVRKLSWQQSDLTFNANDEKIAAWQHGAGSLELLRVWHPLLNPDRLRVAHHVPMRPEALQGLAAGFFSNEASASSTAPLLCHVLVLGDPMSQDSRRAGRKWRGGWKCR